MKIIHFTIILLIPLLIFPSAKLDLNHASLEQIYTLPVDSSLALNIYKYIWEHNGLRSFTELWNVRGMNAQSYQRILPLITVRFDQSQDWRTVRIDDLRDRLASEDNPGTGANELWENLLLYPYDLNQATVYDLDGLWNVSLIDAAAVLHHKYQWEDYRYIGQLTDIENLSAYGYRNMRNYLREPDEQPEQNFYGIARIKFDIEQPSEAKEYSLQYYQDEIDNRIHELEDNESTIYQRLLNSGWSADSISRYIDNLTSVRDQITLPGNNYNYQQYTLKAGYSNNFRVGLRFHQGNIINDQFRGYGSVRRYKIIDALILGDYRITIGEGLFMDNGNEFRPRQTEKVRGVYGDLTENSQYGLRGGLIQLRLMDYFYPLAFISKTTRQVISGEDDTVVVLYNLPWKVNTDEVEELTYGGGISIRLDKIMPGTAVEGYYYRSEYDKYFKPEPAYIDLPGDVDQLTDGNFTNQFRGDIREVYALAARSVIFGNISLSLEAARQNQDNYAYILNSRIQYNFFHIDVIWRHYDVGFDNPFNRAFSEQQRFEDTELEKPYRLINPLYAYLQDDPQPKAEQGIYIGTRYQITRQLTISKAYIDIWENIASGLKNYRAEIKIEYHIVYPFMVRLRQKWQKKNLPKTSNFSTSITNETELYFRYFIGEDMISASVTRSQVQLSKVVGSNSEIIAGYYLSGRYEHQFNPGFSMLGGIDAWNGEEMSQWEFEDMGLDFLYGYGMKSYLVLKQRLNDNLFVRFKAKYVNYYHPYYGFEELYDINQQPVVSPGFKDINNSLQMGLLIDYRF